MTKHHCTTQVGWPIKPVQMNTWEGEIQLGAGKYQKAVEFLSVGATLYSSDMTFAMRFAGVG
jgi:hypothetical protein